MNILLVSQCSKQALPDTRRILDQFAERKGDRTWLTPITEAGLKTLHSLLRQRARRNTAVACHWIKGGEIELLWVVGSRRKFNSDGSVPTNYTNRDLLGAISEDNWKHTESIALLASLAGLFHDFGKGNKLFQLKLRGKRGNSEPIRHEWLSVRLFQAFVGDRKDKNWLAHLQSIEASDGQKIIETALQDKLKSKRSPLYKLRDRPIAWGVAWLLLTHHRLPVPDKSDENGNASEVEKWQRRMKADWNSPQARKNHLASEWEDLWCFPYGLPVESDTWRKRAQSMARRALHYAPLAEHNWEHNTFVLHLARCALMLADHRYSSTSPTIKWQDTSYSAYANTDREKENSAGRSIKQRLDEHNIGVSHNAYLIAKSLPSLTALLPSVGDVRPLRKPAKEPFAWQNKAFGMATQCRDLSKRQGGFFINMASTGTGKTLANARMAYGLSHDKQGCRFSVLLGLRALTLQTGDALQQRIGLGKDELAVLVGSAAVRELHERRATNDNLTGNGSESADELISNYEHVFYSGELTQTRIGKWLETQSGRRGGGALNSLLSAPVLVSTIDRLIPATESARGGHQIAPMLRLLSADTILDESDDFDLNDLPALCRLVNWIGLLGSRVILSSATLPPSLIEALFEAYSEGRRQFNLATIGIDSPICCGWVDEYANQHGNYADSTTFAKAHATFCQKRVNRIEQREAPQQLAEIVPIDSTSNRPADNVATTIQAQLLQLHSQHHQTSSSGKRVSIGLVRMANINPLVAVAKALASIPTQKDTRVHLCVYHSRHPLFRRSEIEAVLDAVLNRHNTETLWQQPSIARALNYPETDQVFVVLATSVAEVGRDHDYDWAVVEPSSVRSIVQLAGRVRRHRKTESPNVPNIALLRQNMKALAGKTPAFIKPGFETGESDTLTLFSHALDDVLPEDIYKHPNAIARVLEPSERKPKHNLAHLEHEALRQKLFGFDGQQNKFPAQFWWKAPVRWCYQMQRKTPFRAGRPQDLYAMIKESTDDDIRFEKFSESEEVVVTNTFQIDTLQFADRVQPWATSTDDVLYATLDEEHDDVVPAARHLMTFSLDQPTKDTATVSKWRYNWFLGMYIELS